MNKPRCRRWCVVGLVPIAATVMAGCSSGGGTSSHTGAANSKGSATSGGTINLARSQQFDGWKPDASSALVDYETDEAVMQPLLTYSPDGTKIVPALAKSWKVSPDGRSITFTLQPGAAFSTGAPVTEADIAFSVKQWKKGPNYGPNYADITSVSSDGPHRFVFHLSRPNRFIIDTLTWASAAIIPKNFNGMSARKFYRKPIGAGPFKIESWTGSGDGVLVRNPHYWDKSASLVNKIQITEVQDQNQLALGFTSHKYDIVEDVAIATAAQYGDAVKTSAPGLVGLLIPNTAKAPFDKLPVRKAIAKAVNTQGIVNGVYKGKYAAKPNGMLPIDGKDWVPPSKPYPDYDPAAAKAAFTAAHLTGKKFTLLYDSGQGVQKLAAQVIQSDLNAAGLKVVVQGLDTTAFTSKMYAGNFDLGLWANSAISPSAMDPVGFMLATKYFFSQFSTKGLTKQVAAYAAATSDTAAKSAVRAIQNQGSTQIPLIPTANLKTLSATQPWVRGFQMTPWGNFHFDRLSVAAH